MAATAAVASLEPSRTVHASGSRAQTYGQILKSTAIIGGSSVINLAVSVARSKAMALLLGPTGVGLVGLYGSVYDLARSFAGMGINRSGVRQIAEAAGSGESVRVARTAWVLRRTSLVLGILGGATIALFSRQISMRTFDTADYAVPVALLSLAVFFSLISDGQAALIQGMRRISDLARIGVISAASGTAVSLTLVYLFRERAVVATIIMVPAMTLAITWWYRRKIHVPDTSLTVGQIRDEAGGLLKLGFAFMASAVLTTGAAYAIRKIVFDGVGLDAAGLYQSAWMLGGLYVGFILQAMGSDFYPRLTAAANRNDECNRLVNEQAHISLLLAGPGLIGTLTFAPVVIAVFYASTFAAAVGPLRWICLGMALRIVAWPMGYVILAKGARAVFFWTEVAATVVHVGLAWVLVGRFGLNGAGMAFFGLYVWHGLLIYAIVGRMSGFTWSRENLQTGLLLLPTIGVVFCGFELLPVWPATAIGLLASVASSIYSLRVLCRLVSLERVPLSVRRLLAWFRIASADHTGPALKPSGI